MFFCTTLAVGFHLFADLYTHMYVYIIFSGRDASLAFITGDFTESGLTDDVSSLSPMQVLALYDWLAFYQREYQSVGM